MGMIKCKVSLKDLRDEVQIRACVALLVRGSGSGSELVASWPVCVTPDEMPYSVLGEEALRKQVTILTFLPLKNTLRNMNTF
jgi:hypothetical protein